MLVSIGIVAYNEEETLPTLLQDICRQDYPHEKIEILLVDSMSSDGTWGIMEKFAEQKYGFYKVKLLKNPVKIIPGGLNQVLRNYEGDAVVRIDAHATIPPDFIRKNVEVLESGEMISGGPRPNVINGHTPWKETLLKAEQSLFGSGVAPYRHQQEKTYVSTIFHGVYRREVYDKVGLYNELLVAAEDNDMSWRIRNAGYKICYSPHIVSYQHTRSTLKKLLRQKYRNGLWIGRTMGINPYCFSLFHFVPFFFVIGIILTAILAVLGYPLLGYLMWSAYGLLAILFTIKECLQPPFKITHIALPILFLLMHLCYGVGTVIGLVEMPVWRNKYKKYRSMQ